MSAGLTAAVLLAAFPPYASRPDLSVPAALFSALCASPTIERAMLRTKAERIRFLIGKGYTTSEIAKAVGCLSSYVRVVAQRADGPSNADRKYNEKYWKTERFKELNRARVRRWHEKNRQSVASRV